MTAAASEGVSIASEGGVLRITLDRPSHKNALDPAAIRCIVAALEAAATGRLAAASSCSEAREPTSARRGLGGANAGRARPRTGSLQRRTKLQPIG